jgi:hypothetical protein
MFVYCQQKTEQNHDTVLNMGNTFFQDCAKVEIFGNDTNKINLFTQELQAHLKKYCVATIMFIIFRPLR